MSPDHPQPSRDASERVPPLHPATEVPDQALQTVAAEEPVAPQLAPATAQMPRMLRAMRNPNYRYFWGGNFLSNVGTWMQNVAQSWLVLQLVDRGADVPALGGLARSGAFWLGVVGFAASAPMLGFALIGGVIADRVDRRRMIMRTQAAMMVFAFLMAGLTWAGLIDIPIIVLLAFASGIAQSLAVPSYQALVPHLVAREDLTNAIGLNSAQFNLSRVLGPTLGGFAMAAFGVAGNFFLNGLSFLAVLFAMTRIQYVPQIPEEEEGANLWQRLAEGFRYVFDNRLMFLLLALVGLASIFGIPYLMFIPLFARDLLGLDERGFGLLMASAGLGSFFGAATIAYLGQVRRRGKFVVRSGVAFFTAIILFTFSRDPYLSALALIVAGYSMILMVATVNSLLQHLSAEEMRGRVMSMYAAAFLGFAPVGSLIAGSLAGAITAPYAIAGMSALALVGTVALYFTRPELRRLE